MDAVIEEPVAVPTEARARDSTRLPVRTYALLLLELVLIGLIVWEFQLEQRRNLLSAMILVLGGFAVHAQLPLSWRLPWFTGLSVVGLLLVLGPAQGAIALALAGLVIATIQLPLSVRARLLLLVPLVAGLIMFRAGSTAPFWPIIGSMFMFRLVSWLHEVRQRSSPPTISATVAYFLMLPNMYFPFFPVVDFRRFCDSYYHGRRERIYQTGIHWLLLGVVQLLAYRFIKDRLLPLPLEIRTLSTLARFLVTNYSLYLLVSGQFHLICGILHLFGFNLPRTHNWYFLASSPSDIWRRINIFWKDFMSKIVFLPVFFRLRPLGRTTALIVAVQAVFCCTWLAHSWQYWWLLGEFPLRVNDAAIWLGAGVLVTFSLLVERRHGSARRHATSEFRWTVALGRSLRTLLIFTLVSLFWAQWTHPHLLPDLLYGPARVTVSVRDVQFLALWSAVALFAGCAVQFALDRRRRAATSVRPVPQTGSADDWTFDVSVARHVLVLAPIVLLGVQPLHEALGIPPHGLLASLQKDAFTDAVAREMFDGYYEQLNHARTTAAPILNASHAMPGLGGQYAAMTRPRRDLLELELIPGWRGLMAGAETSVNRWGMRDRDRTLAKTPETFRIAMVGSSCVMGFGVRDEETFSCRLEDLLNASPEFKERRIEVLNFGVGKYFPIHRRLQIEHAILRFQPDLILYFAHQDEIFSSVARLTQAVMQGMDLEDACLDDLVHRAAITPETSPGAIQILLERELGPILECTYERIRRTCQTAGVRLIWVELPMPGGGEVRFDTTLPAQIARQTGLDCLDLSDWAIGHKSADISLYEGDNHPNALGHRLIAERLVRALREQAGFVRN